MFSLSGLRQGSVLFLINKSPRSAPPRVGAVSTLMLGESGGGIHSGAYGELFVLALCRM
jgi:hypothetical protein